MALLFLPSISRLATIDSINGKTVASTPIFTVPTGKSLVVTGMVVRVTAATAITAPATAQVETTTNAHDVFASDVMTNTLAANDSWTFAAGAKSVVVAGGATVSLNITAGATGTSQTLSVDLSGYLI